MNVDKLTDFFLNQSPIFVISFMGLIVAGLALAFGIYVMHLHARRKD